MGSQMSTVEETPLPSRVVAGAVGIVTSALCWLTVLGVFLFGGVALRQLCGLPEWSAAPLAALMIGVALFRCVRAAL